MRTPQAKAPTAFIAFLVFSLLFSLSSVLTGAVQNGDPPSNNGQVIAHGVAVLPGATARWQVGILTAPPGNIAQFGSFVTGFAVGWEQPVIATEGASGTSTYLEPGQAAFHSGGSTLRVSSTTSVDHGFIYIELTTAEPSLGAEFTGDPFTAPGGTHDVRLTSGILAAGETGSFVPANDLPYLLYLFAGSVQVTDADGTIASLAAGDAMQLDGASTLLAPATASAHWMIASIGPQVTVPPLPTPVTSPTATPSTPTATQATSAPSGSLVVQLLRCPDGTDPLLAPTECVISDIVWDITLAPQGSTDPASERTLVADAVDIGNTTYRFTDLAPGTWVVQPDMSGMTPEQRIEITGDTVPLGGIWGVEITASEEAELYVYLIDPPASAGTGDLIIEMFDCPPGVDPLVDASTCTLAVDVPNVEVSRITQSETIIYNTAWDAVSPDSGTFIFEDIESGLFLLIPEDGGLWTAEAVTMGGDAFWDNGFWSVTVPIDGGSVYVAIYHTPAGPPEPTEVTDVPQGIGRLWITQVDCPEGTTDPLSEPGCGPSTAPWEVIVTNTETGESWTLFENATLATTGSWEFTLPAGSYSVEVVSDSAWQVDYESFITVTEGGLSEVMVYSIPPIEQ